MVFLEEKPINWQIIKKICIASFFLNEKISRQILIIARRVQNFSIGHRTK